MFRKHKISLVESGLGTADDHGACGVEDLHEHAPEGGHAVLAVNVESGGAAGDVETIDLRRSIDGGEDLNYSALAITISWVIKNLRQSRLRQSRSRRRVRA